MKRNGYGSRRQFVYYRCEDCKRTVRRPASDPIPEYPQAPCPKCGKLFPAKKSSLGFHVRSCDGLGGTPKEIRTRKRRAKPPPTEEALKRERIQRMESYYRNRDKILKRRRERYLSDAAYREEQLNRSRMYCANPNNTLKLKKRRNDYYWNHVDEAKRRSKEWIEQNRERFLRREAARRAANREQNRANARLQAALLTDSYVRNQLSKYSTKSTHEWTPEEVSAKRLVTIHNRAKRITDDKAKDIRRLYSEGGFSAQDLADRFCISISNVFMIVNNKTHYDPTWRFTKIKNVTDVKRILTLINASAELTKLYGNE